MNFVGIIGEPGSGKTNLLTKYLHEYNCEGWPVSANYGLKFEYMVKGFHELAALPDDLNGVFSGVDELGVGADSYEFMATNSKKLTKLAAEIRKRGCIIAYSVQYFRWIAPRLRTLTDTFILMDDLDKDIDHCKHFKDMSKCPGKPTCNGYVCRGEFARIFLDKEQNYVGEDIFDGNPYWDMYDTSEIIFPPDENYS